MAGTLKPEGRTLEVVTVAMDVDAVCREPAAVMARLAEALGAAEGDRLIVLPPLLANVMALPGLNRSSSMAKAVRRASRGRWGRRLAVWFTYPHARRHRRPWLVMHDVVHSALRRHIGGFAEATASSVVGTVLLSHPRTHWEAWPDHGELFHTAWSFSPDGEPYDVVRQPRCTFPVLKDAHLDGNEKLEVRTLHTRVVDVCPTWGEQSPDAPVAWLPEVTLTGSTDAPDETFAERVGGAQVAVRSALTGQLGQSISGEATLTHLGLEGRGETLRAPLPTSSEPFTWVSVEIELPVNYATEEPTGAP
ncbi:MAG: hypothetical protein ACPGU1_16475 [Myxococcota bacterium]